MNKALAIVLVVMSMAACKRDKPRCWQCNYTYTGAQNRTGDTTLCGLAEADIDIREGLEFDASAAGYDTWRIENCSDQ